MMTVVGVDVVVVPFNEKNRYERLKGTCSSPMNFNGVPRDNSIGHSIGPTFESFPLFRCIDLSLQEYPYYASVR